ncbi:MAG: hypothetical protein ACT4O2_13045 [Beijerinckiaceae bacterium]
MPAKKLVPGGEWAARRMKAMRLHLIAEAGLLAPHVSRLIVRLPAGFPNLIGDAAATGAAPISRAPGSRLSRSFVAVFRRVLRRGVAFLWLLPARVARFPHGGSSKLENSIK